MRETPGGKPIAVFPSRFSAPAAAPAFPPSPVPPQPPDKSLIARRFGSHAASYDDVTPVQAGLWQNLASRIAAHRNQENTHRILELGCGTGALTAWLHLHYPETEVTAVDLAPEMAAMTAQRCPAARITVADAEEYVEQNPGPYDLICSSAAVQWFAQPRETLQKCRNLLQPGGLLAVATFGPDTFHELRSSFAAVETGIDRVLQPPSAAQWLSIFPEADMQESKVVLHFPDVRTFLASVQQAGANAAPSGPPHPLRRSVYQAMLREYTSRFAAPDGGITATYHLITLCLRAHMP